MNRYFQIQLSALFGRISLFIYYPEERCLQMNRISLDADRNESSIKILMNY